MGKYQEEKKTPIIMVKKRRTLLPPSLSEKTGVIARSETVKMEDPVSVGSSSPAVDTHPPEASASKGSPQNSEKSYAKVFRASVRAETSRLPVCGSAARRNRRLG